MAFSVSVDIGGTFTDLFGVEQGTGRTFSAKSLTTYDNLARGLFNCLDEANIDIENVDTLVHGSTIAINIAIQRKGANTALIVTKGTRDVYHIGRASRPQSYDVFFRRTDPFVEREHIFEVDERHLATGEVFVALDRAHARSIAEQVRETGVDAVAVCFLHSYLRPEHELLMGEELRAAMPGAHISLSHEIVREYREYERTSTTVVNAYVGPECRDYLNQIEAALGGKDFAGAFLVMQSNGGVMTPGVARRVPVAMMESGPVGGVIASAHLGDAIGRKNMITFDMGGTTAKMSVITDGAAAIASGYYIGEPGEGHPTMLPVVDIVEIGAGGGSIGWLDEVGALHVGPHSAGSAPGPICYGLGGLEPTVTDANLLLGRLSAENFLGGNMHLDVEAARRGMEERLGSLGLAPHRLAAGIVRLAIASMVLAVRGVSVERGYDPRDFALVAQGGNGPLHALQVARELGIPEVIIPPLPGIFSAVGMLLADLRHDFVRTHYGLLDSTDFDVIAALFEEMRAEGRQVLADEGVEEDGMVFNLALDLRYLNQEFALSIPVSIEKIEAHDIATIRAAFDQAHDARYGHSGPDESVELINLRLVAIGENGQKPALTQSMSNDRVEPERRRIWLDDMNEAADCAVYQRDRLARDSIVHGPAVIEERNSTTLLWPGDIATLSANGSIIVKVGKNNG